MKQFYLACIVILGLVQNCFSQQDKIQTDRPGKALTPHLTDKGRFQLEVGFEKEQQNKDDYSLLHPEVLLKYGVYKWLEVRTEINSESEKQYSLNQLKYGIKPVEVGIKARLLEQKGVAPTTSIHAQVGIPQWASKDYQATRATTEMRAVFENKLTKTFHLNYNVGVEWNGEDPNPVWLYTIDQEVDLGKKWEAFVEIFGYFAKGQASQHSADGGLAYLLTKNCKLDVSGGLGLNKESPDYFISAGLSFRLK